MLRNLDVSDLVVTGIQTPNCVRSTAFEAISYDLGTSVLSDGTSAATPQIHESNLLDMRNIGIRVQSCEEAIGEIGKLKG